MTLIMGVVVDITTLIFRGIVVDILSDADAPARMKGVERERDDNALLRP